MRHRSVFLFECNITRHLTYKKKMYIFIGYYSLSGASICTICSAGDNCSNPAVAPTPCTAGTYSNQGDSGCTNCAAGKIIHTKSI